MTYSRRAASIALATAAAIYSKAFLETLGKRSGEGVADLSKRLGDLVLDRRKGKKGKPDEYLSGVEGETGGLYGLADNIGGVAVIFFTALGVIHVGRKVRDVKPPERKPRRGRRQR
jgi:hypothetical protein